MLKPIIMTVTSIAINIIVIMKKLPTASSMAADAFAFLTSTLFFKMTILSLPFLVGFDQLHELAGDVFEYISELFVVGHQIESATISCSLADASI